MRSRRALATPSDSPPCAPTPRWGNCGGLSQIHSPYSRATSVGRRRGPVEHSHRWPTHLCDSRAGNERSMDGTGAHAAESAAAVRVPIIRCAGGTLGDRPVARSGLSASRRCCRGRRDHRSLRIAEHRDYHHLPSAVNVAQEAAPRGSRCTRTRLGAHLLDQQPQRPWSRHGHALSTLKRRLLSS